MRKITAQFDFIIEKLRELPHRIISLRIVLKTIYLARGSFLFGRDGLGLVQGFSGRC